MVKIADRDPMVMSKMRQIVDYQQAQIDKKTKLLQAIQHNIDYMSHLHQLNQQELFETQQQNENFIRENHELREQIYGLEAQVQKFKNDSEQLIKEQAHIAELIIERDTKQKEIFSLRGEIERKLEKVQKMDMDLTVIFTEKQAYKKEVDRQDQEIRMLTKEISELKMRNELLEDENTKKEQQNAEYRDLILGNENKMKIYREEVRELQRKVENRDQHIERLQDKITQLKNEIEKLSSEVNKERDEKTQLIEENRQIIMDAAIVFSDEQLKLKFQSLQNDFEFKKKEWEANEDRLISQLNFSKEANENLKKDYDLLQEKFENYMRNNNQINEDLKDEIEKVQKQNDRLKFQLDDFKKEMEDKIAEANFKAQRAISDCKDQIEEKNKELDETRRELVQMKSEYTFKMTKIKLLELELNRKIMDDDPVESQIKSFQVILKMSQNSLSHQRPTQSSKLKQHPNHAPQVHSRLPDKIDTKKVVEMIKNGDLYELINISMNQNELPNEAVEELIHKALQKSGNHQNSHRHRRAQENTDLVSMFTPPTKVQQRSGTSTSPINQSTENDENRQIISDFIVQSAKSQKHQLQNFGSQFRTGKQVFRMQAPLQTSILENKPDDNEQCIPVFNQNNSQVHLDQQHFFNYQSFNSKNVNEDHTLDQNNQNSCFGNEIDDTQDFEHQEQRHLVPQPYHEKPRSPAEEEEQTEQSTQLMHRIRNPSFSGDLNFIRSSIQQSNLQESMSYHGDQFSFQQKQNSFCKKSQENSNYSTINKDNEITNIINGSHFQEMSDLQKSSQKHKYQAQIEQRKERNLFVEEPSQTFENSRKVLRQEQQQQMNRSASSNSFLTSKDLTNNSGLSSSRNLNNGRNLFNQRTQVQTSRSPIQQPYICKTPDASQSFLDQHSFLNSNIKQEDLNQTQNLCDNQRMNQPLKKNIEIKKQRLLNSFSQMNIKFLIELERIKKPSQVAYVTARLVCQFFAIFREMQSASCRSIHMEDIIEWTDIQRHINQNVIKHTNDLLSQIKSKMLQPEQMNQSIRDYLEKKLLVLKKDFFQGDNLKLFKHLSTNKNLQTIVTFIFNVIAYYLDLQYNEKLFSQNPLLLQDTSSLHLDSQRLTNNSRQPQQEDTQTRSIPRLMNQTLSSKSLQRSNDQSQQKKKSRNMGGIEKSETTPITHRDRTPQNGIANGNRCLLQRRDRSQLIKNDPYQSNKSPMVNKRQQDSQIDNHREIEKEVQITQRKHNFDVKRRQLPKQRQKSLSKSPSQAPAKKLDHQIPQNPFTNNSTQKPQNLNENTLSQSQKSQKFDYYFPIDFQNDQECEEVFHLDYKMMVQSTSLSQLIKEKAAVIEENMRIGSQQQDLSDNENTSTKKNIDMSIIEQIKQRRKDQKMKEAIEERGQQSASRRQNNENL